MKRNSILYSAARLLMVPLLTLLTAAGTGCSDDIAKAPVVRVLVDGMEFTGEALEAALDQTFHYRFEITAFATIADLKLIEYDVLNEEVKIPTETLVGGLTYTRNEVVEGYVRVVNNAEYRLVVKDVDGNEVSAGFSYYIP
ncbi:MAG: hypothetical protein LUD76_11890 [Alistipes sp.]|nr:hypothetical protein [Alistipes sp.]